MTGLTESISRRGGRRFEVLLFLLTAALVGVRNYIWSRTGSMASHLAELADSVTALRAGPFAVKGVEIADTGLSIGGPVYAWLNAPALLFDNPVRGVEWTYLIYMVAALGVWIFCPTEPLLPRRTRLVAALPLALFCELHVELIENTTLLGILAVPLFVVFLNGLRARSAWRMLAPGVLAGFSLQVHVMTLFLLPILGLGVLARRERWLQRGLALGLGLAVVVLAFLRAYSGESGVAEGSAWSWLQLQSWMGPIQTRAVALVAYPAALLGIGVTAARWVRRPAASLGATLAVIWLLAGITLICVGYAYNPVEAFDPYAALPFEWLAPLVAVDLEHRFALVNPARAVLMAVAAIWIHERVSGWLARPGVSLPGPHVLSLWVGVAALLHMGWHARAIHGAEPRLRDGHRPAHNYRLRGDLLLTRPAPLQYHRKDGPEAHGLEEALDENLYALRAWHDLSVYETGPGAGAKLVVAAPSLEGFDLGQLAGARPLGDGFRLPGCRPAGTDTSPSRRWASCRFVRPGQGDLVLISAETRDRDPASLKVRLGSASAPLRRVAHARYVLVDDRVVGWHLYLLPPTTRDPVQLRVTGI